MYQVSFRVAGFGRLVLQPLLTLHIPGQEGGNAPLLRCTAYTVSPIGLLQVRWVIDMQQITDLQPSSVGATIVNPRP